MELFKRKRNYLGETKNQELERRIQAMEEHFRSIEERFTGHQNQMNETINKQFEHARKMITLSRMADHFQGELNLIKGRLLQINVGRDNTGEERTDDNRPDSGPIPTAPEDKQDNSNG